MRLRWYIFKRQLRRIVEVEHTKIIVMMSYLTAIALTMVVIFGDLKELNVSNISKRSNKPRSLTRGFTISRNYFKRLKGENYGYFNID